MKKKIILGLVILLALTSGVFYGLLSYNYSKGIRSGRLVKLSQKGVAYKTYEGTLDLGSGDKLTWDFSVHDKQLAEKLSRHSGKIVKLAYREILFKLFYDSVYDVTSYDVLEDGAGTELFCRLVQVMRRSQSVVRTMRDLVQEYDSSLLDKIRECQD